MEQRRSVLSAGRENPRWQGEGIALSLARTIMVCGIRKPHTLGYEMLPVGGMIKITLIQLALTTVLNFPLVVWIVGNQIARGDDSSLRLFALAFLGVGLWLRHQRKREKWSPERPHRFDPGVSWFHFLPIREDYVYRFVDPGVAFLVGGLLRSRLGCPLLGLWWMVAALALGPWSGGLHQQTEQHDWQLGDAPKEAAISGTPRPSKPWRTGAHGHHRRPPFPRAWTRTLPPTLNSGSESEQRRPHMDWNNVNLDRKTRIFLPIAVGIALLWLLWPSLALPGCEGHCRCVPPRSQHRSQLGPATGKRDCRDGRPLRFQRRYPLSRRLSFTPRPIAGDLRRTGGALRRARYLRPQAGIAPWR